MKALAIATLLGFGLMLPAALPARGCSCVMPDPYGGLADADGAFVGTLTAVEQRNGSAPGEPADFHFDVEASLKGEIGESIVVRSSSSSASCGLEMPVGSRAGLLLTREGDVWHGNLCATLDPDLLLTAAEGPPEPVSGSPPHLIVAANMGGAGLVALDRQGRVVGYGEGPQPTLLSACPDEQTFIGVSSDNVIRVWSFTGLSVVREVRLPEDIAPWYLQVMCVGPAGDPFLAVTTLSGVDQSTLVHHADGVTDTTGEDVAWLVATAAGPVAVAADGSMHTVDPETGEMSPLPVESAESAGRVSTVTPSPDGSHVAITSIDWEGTPIQSQVVIVDLEAATSTSTVFSCDVYPTWIDDERITIWDSCNNPAPGVYDQSLQYVGEGDPADPGAQQWTIVDEEGTSFHPNGFGISSRAAASDTDQAFGPRMGYAPAALLVPVSARDAWAGSEYVPDPVTATPPVTYVEAPVPGQPVVEPEPAGFDAPVWLVVVGSALVVAVLWLLLSGSIGRGSAGPPTEERPA